MSASSLPDSRGDMKRRETGSKNGKQDPRILTQPFPDDLSEPRTPPRPTPSVSCNIHLDQVGLTVPPMAITAVHLIEPTLMHDSHPTLPESFERDEPANNLGTAGQWPRCQCMTLYCHPAHPHQFYHASSSKHHAHHHQAASSQWNDAVGHNLTTAG